jgi:hypothetical protein
MNAVAFRESGGRFDSTIQSRRLSKVWPPTGFPGQAFVYTGNRVRRIDNWGDGDADLTQLDVTVPSFIRADQRRFVTFIDVIRVLRHTATRDPRLVPFDSTYGRHAFHADVNHNGRFYYSTRNYNNTGDSTVNGNLVRYRVPFQTKSTNYQLPFPNDNSFSGFLFDADQQDAALIMLYLAAKLPVLPWLPDTLPAFTGKAATAIASDIQMGKGYTLTGKQVEIPVTFNSYLNGALGVAMDAANGTRIIGVKPMAKRDGAWVEAVATEGRVAIAAAGTFQPEDVVATLIVEAADNGDVTFSNVTVGDKAQGVRKFNVSGAVTGATGVVSLDQNTPNPFSPNVGTTIGYSVATDGKAVVRLFDQLGREVKTLVDADLKAGSYQIQWDGRDALGNVVESGVYFCRIEAAGQTLTRAMQVRK